MVDLPKLGLEISVAGAIDSEIDNGYWLTIQGEGAKLPDGWTFTHACPAIDPKVHGVEYYVHVHRTIGGKPFHCSFKGAYHESIATAALAACKTLRPTKR